MLKTVCRTKGRRTFFYKSGFFNPKIREKKMSKSVSGDYKTKKNNKNSSMDH